MQQLMADFHLSSKLYFQHHHCQCKFVKTAISFQKSWHMLIVYTLICCRYVLEETTQYVQVDCRDNAGRSAFMKACETGRREVVDYLLAKGASVNVEDLCHRTPLHVACENGHEDIVKILLDREANLDVQDCYTGAELCFLIRGKDKGKYPVSTVNF